MPVRTSIKQYPTPAAQGEDSWVRLKRPTVEQMNRVRGAVKSQNGMSEEDKNSASTDMVLQIIRENLIEWNWVDDDGEPLPSPQEHPEVLDKVTDLELKCLADLFNAQQEAEAEQRKNLKPG